MFFFVVWRFVYSYKKHCCERKTQLDKSYKSPETAKKASQHAGATAASAEAAAREEEEDPALPKKLYRPHCHTPPRPPPPPQSSLSAGVSLEFLCVAYLSGLKNSFTGGERRPSGLLPLATPPCALACAAATPASASGTESTRARVTLENEARGGRSEAAAEE